MPPSQANLVLTDILNAIADGILIHDENGQLLYANEIAEQLVYKHIIFDEDGQVLNILQNQGQIIAKARSRETNAERWITIKSRSVQNGNIPVIVSLFQDITDYHQLEQELRQNERELRDFVENAVVALHWVDAKGKIIWANQAELDLLGYTWEEYIGRHIAEFHVDQDVIKDILSRLSNNEILQAYESRLRCKDGSIRYVMIDSNVMWEKDRFLHTRCFTRDITSRKQAEQNAIQLQIITAALSEALTPVQVADVIVHQGLKRIGARAGSVVLLDDNRTMMEVVASIGYTSQIVDKWRRFSITMPVPLTECIGKQKPVWIRSLEEFKIRYPDVSDTLDDIHQSWAALPLIVKGEVIGALGLSFATVQTFDTYQSTFMLTLAGLCAQAIERARLYEMEILARQSAEKANKLKMQFLGMISHELRTPLTAIKGLASTLLDKDVTFDSDSTQQFIQIIDEEANRLTGLVEQLLDLSLLQAGTLSVEPTPQSIKNIIEMAIPQIYALTKEHNLSLVIPDTLPPVLADSQRIVQVLTNLVHNAVKYSPPHTQIIIEALYIGSYIQVNIVDEGVGILPENRVDVFEAFRQLNKKLTTQSGVGLGLAICKGLIEAHKGQIWIQEQPSSGTTVSFTLPVH